MTGLINWMHKNRGLNLVILAFYFLLVVLPHEVVGRFLMNDLMGHLSRAKVNAFVLTSSLTVFIVFLSFLIIKLKNGKQRRAKLVYISITILLIILVYNTLFVLATESAHFPQYAIMAILLFPLTLNYNSTLFSATFLGLIDEAYQYFYLNPNATGYLDFNDVVTDFLGAVLGLLLIWVFDVKGSVCSKPWYKRSSFLIGMSTLVAYGLLRIFGIISIYPKDDGTMAPITLMKKIPSSFWSYDKVGDIYFHIMHPIEGVFIICILLMIYASMGKSSFKSTS